MWRPGVDGGGIDEGAVQARTEPVGDVTAQFVTAVVQDLAGQAGQLPELAGVFGVDEWVSAWSEGHGCGWGSAGWARAA